MTKPTPTHRRFIALISGVATLGGFLFGFDSGVINGAIDGLEGAFGSSAAATGFAVASVLLGCAGGAFAAAWLADRLGRRTVLMGAAMLFLVSALAAGAATSPEMFVAARIIGGLAVGAASVLSPAYISEVTPAATRGRLSSLQQVMIIVGLTAAFLSNYLLARLAGGSMAPLWGDHPAWRWMFWIQAAPSLLFLVALFGIPESPRFLAARGRNKQALGVLERLMGTDAAAIKLAEIRASLEGNHTPRFRDLQVAGQVRPIVWVGIGLATLQQLVGINVVFYYGAVLWQAVGFSEADALGINVVSGAISVLACLAALSLIDRIGRKPLLLAGSVGMTITLSAMAWAFSAGGQGAGGSLELSGRAGIIALVAANLYVACFNFSWGPVMWVMLGEMFPNQIRGSALAVSGAAQWTANFAITLTFPMLLRSVGLGMAYAVYALFAALSIAFVATAIRETRGVELEAMRG